MIPYHNQPIHQNAIYPGPVENSTNIIPQKHLPFIQHVLPGSAITHPNYLSTSNKSEDINTHYPDEHKTAENTFESSNKIQLTQQNENHIYENGELQSADNITAKQKNEEAIVQKQANKSWASLFSQKNNHDQHNNHSEVNGKHIESVDEFGVKSDMDNNLESPIIDNSISNDYSDPVYYRLGGKI